MITRKVNSSAKIAVFAVVHGTYFQQFEGLQQTLESYHADFTKILRKNGVEIFDFGMIEDNTKAFEVSQRINAENVDLIICNMITYATSSVFSPIIQVCNAPMILAALQPLAALDYTKANIFKCDTYTYGTDNTPGVGSNNKHYGSIMSDCRGTDYQWENVYVISNVALAYTSTKVDYCADATNKDASCTKFTGVSRYDTQGDFEQATGNDYTSFSNTYWDITSGVPVWKN